MQATKSMTATGLALIAMMASAVAFAETFECAEGPAQNGELLSCDALGPAVEACEAQAVAGARHILLFITGCGGPFRAVSTGYDASGNVVAEVVIENEPDGFENFHTPPEAPDIVTHDLTFTAELDDAP